MRETINHISTTKLSSYAATSPSQSKCFRELLVSVGYGEAAGIAVAKEQGLLFFSDDKKARQVAKEQGLEVSGILGSLKPARHRELRRGGRVGR